jgi:dolichyl-phosphate-mannose--protein O-mannosyl transferase
MARAPGRELAAGSEAATPASAAAGETAAPAAADVWVVVALLAVTLVATFARVPRLGAPPHMVFDEIYYAKAAQQILAGVEVTEERTHPPLSKLIIAGGIRLFGDHAVGWRAASAAAGVLVVLVVGLLAWLLFGDRFVAAASALLVALDGLVFVESRIAKPDIFLALFLFSAYAAFWRYVQVRAAGPPPTPAGGGAGWLYLAGTAAGCAVATKWTAAVPLAVIPVALALLIGLGRLMPSRRDLGHVALALVVLPAVLYMLTYIPYFALGHGLRDFVAHQADMFRFHAGLTEGHPYQSAWYSWPFLVRPIWYEYREAAPQIYEGIIAIGNPIIWWGSLPAIAYLAVRGVRTRGLPETFVVGGFILAYAQYAVIGRVLFLYHFLLALPFLIMSLAVGLGWVRQRVGGAVVLAFLGLTVGWLVAFYPVLAALPTAADRIYRLMWFGSWI